jgi:hypothetical protein
VDSFGESMIGNGRCHHSTRTNFDSVISRSLVQRPARK